MTNPKSPANLPPYELSPELLALVRQLAAEHPLPAELADEVAPVTARLLKARIAGPSTLRGVA